MIDDDFVKYNLVTDVYHLELDSVQILNYVYKQIDEYNANEDNESPFVSGNIKLSEPLIKKISKAFTTFQKRNELPFQISAAPFITVEHFETAKNISSLCGDNPRCSSVVIMVLEDHTHSSIVFYPTAPNTNKLPRNAPSYEFFCGEGQTHLINTKIPHQCKTKQRGTRIVLALQITTGFHRINRHVT